jgi:hypothetical protein
MPTASKAVLLNLGVMLADTNIRRSIGAFTYNFTSPTASVQTNSFTISPGDSIIINTMAAVSAFSMISTNFPLTCSFVFGPSSGISDYALPVSRLHLVDSDVRQIVLQNTSTTDSAKVNVIQA